MRQVSSAADGPPQRRPAPARAEKLARLRQVLEEYNPDQGTGLFDSAKEEAKAEVRKRALLLLDHRARSRHELRTRLLDLAFEPRVVEDVLDDLHASHLVDDEQFARDWVRQRHQRRGKSRRVLDRELSQKGVAAETRSEALEQIDPAEERDTAYQLAEKKARSIKSVPEDRRERDKQLRRVLGVLARRGFPEGMAFQVAREVLDDRIAELGE